MQGKKGVEMGKSDKQILNASQQIGWQKKKKKWQTAAKCEKIQC